MNPKALLLPILLAVLHIGTPHGSAATFPVTVTNDAGAGSLRQAIVDANTSAGADLITFNIVSGGLTIFPASALPVVSESVTIDATTQPGFAGSPLIELAGASAGAAANGLHISAGGSTVRGLAINRFTASGIRLSTNGNNIVEGCFIGTGIGGTNDRGNTADGIVITTNSANNIIGGTTAAARNVISGNNQHGVHIIGANATNNLVIGNIIGLGLNNVDFGNSGDGVRLVAPRNRVGGTTVAERNVISGNNSDGIEVVGTNAPGCVIQGNYVGTDINGTLDRGNSGDGILVSGAPDTLIGGTVAGAGNLLSGNDDGVELNGLTAAFNRVLGNRMGTDASGTLPLPNGVNGVLITANARTNTIGGVGAGEANTIAFNAADGVNVATGTNNAIRGNLITANGNLGIDLGANGVQTNDVNDADGGPNQLQNYPLLSGATGGAGTVQITGTLNSRASTTYQIDFYANYAADSLTNGEGQQYLGSASVSTDAGGNATINASVAATLTGRFVTATATDPDGNTSEFSKCVEATVTVPGSNFVVTTTNDFGQGSLRQAILDANAAITAGDKITFNLPGAGVQIIYPTRALPLITDPVIVDGYTQSGSTTNSSPTLFNGLPLIFLDGLAAGTGVDGLRISAGNSVIRGLIIGRFSGDGIEIVTNGNNVIEGCLLGIEPVSVNIWPNAAAGIHIISTAGNRIGGTTPAARNVISGNSGIGVHIENVGASNNVVLGNLIGPDFTGAIDRGNSGDGVQIDDAPSNIVGGPTPAERNVISGNNGDGIEIFSLNGNGNVVIGNFIGTDASGALPLANGAAGINLSTTARNNLIGGPTAGAGNRIAFNAGDGVFISAGTNNAIRGNAIFANSTVAAGLGIDLGANGITPNDANDADAGANQLQNFPILTSATANVGSVQVSGVLTSAPSTTFQIDFFVSPVCDTAGNGEGQFYLGSAAATTDAGGIAAISATLPVTLTNRYITATATDPFGNTSEFSPCLRTGSTIPATTFTVVNTNDSGPGSLREIIAQHNNTASATPNSIRFNIPGAGVQTIRPLSALPTISEPVTIDGLTQPGTTANSSPNAFNAGLLIRLVGASAGAGVDGLRFTASTNTVRGLVVINFTGDGLEFATGTAGNRVESCLIGLDLDGTDQGNAGNGILLSGSAGNRIGGETLAARNVISGNNNDGIEINGTNANANVIAGNLIGLDPSGTIDRGNGADGVIIIGAPGNVIGGTNSTARNVISGNGSENIEITGAGSIGNSIRGNYIGLNASGTLDGGTSGTGVYINGGASGNVVGGAAAGARNVVSGNAHGVYLQNPTTTANLVLGNFIGTDAGGTYVVANSLTGMVLDNAPGNIVGGAAPGERNVISGNADYGVSIAGVSASNNVVHGNLIGSDLSGALALPNGIYGVYLSSNPRGNRIGGPGAGEGNIITGHPNDGVHVASGTNNAIRGNLIFNNAGLGIDLAPNGVTTNDVADADGGANQLQNFPGITAATNSSSGVTIVGTLNSAASTTFDLDFYASQTCDETGHGEGAQYLGAGTVTTDGSGNGAFLVSLPAVMRGRYVTATATDPFGNTSEFSACVAAASTVPPTNLVVTTTADSGPGSLREAIALANNFVSGGNDVISFNIPGVGSRTIAPASALPALLDGTTIDGYTQPGASANTLSNGHNAVIRIILSGANAPVDTDGLELFGPNSIVRGLSIVGFGGAEGDGVRISGGTGSRVEGCFIGLEPDGSTRRGNGGNGVHIAPLSAQLDTRLHTIGGLVPAARNVISANGYGIYADASGSNSIAGNHIGTDAAGLLSRGNTNGGVLVAGVKSVGNQIGGPGVAYRNVISGNSFEADNGAVALIASSRTLVGGNFIGVDATGANALPNAGTGVELFNSGTNIIGGLTAGSANVISGNSLGGVLINGSSSENRLQGNLIGTDATGTRALPNIMMGVQVANGAGNVIGGPEPGAGNVISGNREQGVELFTTSQRATVVQGNFIGTDRTGTLPLGNNGGGVVVESSRHRVESNVIAFSAGPGVYISGGVGSTVTANSIYNNGNFGIDLGSFGVLANDPGDLDAGVNSSQNYPALSNALRTANSTVVVGTLNSQSNQSYRLEFFDNTECDSSNFGEGRTFLGSLNVTTDAGGNANFTFTHPAPIAFAHYITATATDTNGSTSEFSRCVKVIPVDSVDLAVTTVDSADPVPLASNLVYSVTVQNNGPTNATGVVLTDRLSPGVTFVSATAAQGSCSQAAGVVTCNVGSVARGGATSVTITVRPTTYGLASNYVSVASAEFDHTPENNSDIEITRTGVANMAVAINANPNPVVAGQVLTFTVTAINLGPDPAPVASLSFSVDRAFCEQSIVVSQGTVARDDSFLEAVFGQLPVNGQATLTVSGVAGVDQPLFSSAGVSGGTSDLDTSNNFADDTVTVLPGAGLLRFELPNVTVNESGGPAFVNVIRTGGSVGALTVQYATSNLTAVAGSDFTSASGTLTFAAGETFKQFTVTVRNDTNSECNELLLVRLFNPTGGGGATVLCPDTEATVTITDDDGVYSGNVLLVSQTTNQPVGSGDGFSNTPSVDASGRFVAFESDADNLVPGDNNSDDDVFVRDLVLGTTRLISRDGLITYGYDPVISGSGSNIVFSTSLSGIGAALFVHIGALNTNEAVSVRPDGELASGGSYAPSISSNGVVIAFESYATELVPSSDNNFSRDVFVRDLAAQTTVLVSVNSAGTGTGNGDSYYAKVSADGRYVAFLSDASDLVGNDTNNAPDVFLRDLQAGTTTLVSRRNAGVGSGNGSSEAPVINADGRYVAFASYARDLVATDNTFSRDVFLFDRVTGTNRLVSVNRFPGGFPGDDESYDPSINASGRYIAFVSTATDLLVNDLNGGIADVFVRDVVAGTTVLASLDCAGVTSGNNISFNPVIAGDGRSVAFLSRASDLTSGEFGDFNGGGEETIVAAGGPGGGSYIQLFRRDLTTNRTELVSRNFALTGGANSDSYEPAISFRGVTVAFSSFATDLVSSDDNFNSDVFAWSSSATLPEPEPMLTITRIGVNQVRLSWPSPSTGYNLESTGNLNSPIIWTPVNTTVTDNGLLKSVTLFIDGNTAARFFRLKK